jgi:hypothetical protein
MAHVSVSAVRRRDLVDDLESLDSEAPATAATAAWRVEILRPSRQITVRTRSLVAGTAPSEPDYRARALALWPRLDAVKLRRTRGDVMRIARLVERRTSCSLETIVGMLMRERAD